MFKVNNEPSSVCGDVFYCKDFANSTNASLYFCILYSILCFTGNIIRDPTYVTAQKLKFSIQDFFSKRDQIHRKLHIWLHLLTKCSMENFIFCAVCHHLLMKRSSGKVCKIASKVINEFI